MNLPLNLVRSLSDEEADIILSQNEVIAGVDVERIPSTFSFFSFYGKQENFKLSETQSANNISRLWNTIGKQVKIIYVLLNSCFGILKSHKYIKKIFRFKQIWMGPTKCTRYIQSIRPPLLKTYKSTIFYHYFSYCFCARWGKRKQCIFGV